MKCIPVDRRRMPTTPHETNQKSLKEIFFQKSTKDPELELFWYSRQTIMIVMMMMMTIENFINIANNVQQHWKA
jgi:hypothetical protein